MPPAPVSSTNAVELLLLLPATGLEVSGPDGLGGILVEPLLEVALAVAVALLARPDALLEDDALAELLELDALDEAVE
ncbi:MAG: hypothetical protein AAGI69_07740 [Cyanobacteria bacterium P01_H01_bin.21]